MNELKHMNAEEKAAYKYSGEQMANWGPPAMILGIILLLVTVILFLLMSLDGFPGAMMMLIPIAITFLVIFIGWFAKIKGGEMLARYEASKRNLENTTPELEGRPSELIRPQLQPLTQSAQGKFCPYCGTNNPTDYNYCSQCQKPLPNERV